MASHAVVTSAFRFQMQWRGFSISSDDHGDVFDLATTIRHDVFLEEMQGRPRADGQERDDFDDHYHHLVVRVAATGEPVGACRLVSSMSTDRFYSAGEFDIAPFLRQPGTKVELGRVCLCPTWRNNIALAAIGRGIGHYAKQHGADWLFGCSSIAATSTDTAAALAIHMTRLGACARGFGVTPVVRHAVPGLADAIRRLETVATEDLQVESLIPPLLRLYLKAGAGIGQAPALDEEFACLDFFTTVAMGDHRTSMLGRYVQC